MVDAEPKGSAKPGSIFLAASLGIAAALVIFVVMVVVFFAVIPGKLPGTC